MEPPHLPPGDSGIRLIPPAVFLIGLIAGYGVQYFIPIRLLPELIRYTLGPLLMITALWAVRPALRSFKRAGTPFDARKLPQTLVTDGAFEYSRNPGYVALTVLCIGIAVIANNPWMAVGSLLALAYVGAVIVRAEEAALEARFGEEYRAYKQRVRRWL